MSGLKSKIILGGHVPHAPHPSSARALCDQSRAPWTTLFKILDPPLPPFSFATLITKSILDPTSILVIFYKPVGSGGLVAAMGVSDQRGNRAQAIHAAAIDARK